MQAAHCTMRTDDLLRSTSAVTAPRATGGDTGCWFPAPFRGELDSPFPGMFVEIATLIDTGDEAIKL
jgi:hypothetical protein